MLFRSALRRRDQGARAEGAGARAKVGSQEIPGVAGKFGLGVQNEAGQSLTEFGQENALVIANCKTVFILLPAFHHYPTPPHPSASRLTLPDPSSVPLALHCLLFPGRVEEGLSRSLSGGGGKPSCPSPSAGVLTRMRRTSGRSLEEMQEGKGWSSTVISFPIF